MISKHDADNKNLPLAEYRIDELLPHSLTSAPAVSTRKEDLVWAAVGMLMHHIESFTDSLVVTDGERPIGMLGGFEIIDQVSKNPTSSLFYNTTVEKIMNNNLIITSKQIKLSDLLSLWQEKRRAFAIIPNQYHGYSAISPRKILEIGALCKTDVKVSEIPKKKTVTFKRDDTVGSIITSMFENRTRRLVRENTKLFISDRIIIQKIIRDLNYLRGMNSFFDMKAGIFKLEKAKAISKNSTYPQACKVMLGMSHPYMMAGDQVISPWDLIMFLKSDFLTEYNWAKQENLYSVKT